MLLRSYRQHLPCSDEGGRAASPRWLIKADKPRTLENEQPFFDAISRYFRTTPVILENGPIRSDRDNGETRTAADTKRDDASSDAGADTDAFAPKLFLFQRWRTTSEWKMPAMDDIMSGKGVQGIRRGRDFGYTEQMFAALEWD